MRPALPILLAASLLLSPAPRAVAADPTLAEILDSALALVQDAAERLRLHDRAGAVDLLDEAAALAGEAVTKAGDPATQEELQKLAKKVLAKTGSFRKAVLKAGATMANTGAADLKAVKAAGKAAKAGYGALGAFAKLPVRGPVLTEVKAGSAGFHNPDTDVLMRIYPGLDEFGDPCLETPEVVAVDPYATGAVDTSPLIPLQQPDGSWLVTVTMGSGGGPARVEVTACGVTRRVLLYNYGSPGTFAPKVDVTRFDGTYTGSYSGTATIPGYGSEPVGGAVSVTVSGGVITVTDPGSGSGSLSAKGSAGFQGAGGTDGAAYTFSGKFAVTTFDPVPGSGSASGGWTAVFDGGTARGTWSVSR